MAIIASCDNITNAFILDMCNLIVYSNYRSMRLTKYYNKNLFIY